MQQPPSPDFPDDFLWGASTAAHQVEGGTHNQWSEWEKANAKELARTAEQRLNWLPNWGVVKPYATDPANYISGAGVDHYNRYKEDFDILENLGLNTFRFGVEWSRVQPEEGRWDEAAIRHYHDYIDELNRRGIEPVLTLWHWTMPTWFTDKGGFVKRRNLDAWSSYVHRMADEFGGKVRYVITLNEPTIYTSFSYQLGEWPPQNRNALFSLRVFWNLIRAHQEAYLIFNRKFPAVQIGIAAQLANNQPKNPRSFIDRLLTRGGAYLGNWWFLNRIRASQDFIGLNYYFTNYWHGSHQANPKGPLNDLGWYMEPSGISKVLVELERRYHKPILITENGLADAEDKHRQWWLEQTMQALLNAQASGVRLIGYLHWSLLDNFEWKYGWWPKFGLVAVDREHGMKRTIRPSSRWWAEYIKAHSKTSSTKSK